MFSMDPIGSHCWLVTLNLAVPLKVAFVGVLRSVGIVPVHAFSSIIEAEP